MTVALDEPGVETSEVADVLRPAGVPAGWAARAGAFAVDVLFGLGLLATAMLVAWAAPLRGWLWWLCLVVGVAVFLAMAVNRLLLPSITGWSLGRSLFGIAVVHPDGSRVGPLHLMLRDMAHVLDTAALFIGWLWPLWDARGRTFADLLTRTEVHRLEECPNSRRLAGIVLACVAVLAAAGAGLAYLSIYRQQAVTDAAREQIAEQGPKLVVDTLSYDVSTLQDDFNRAQQLVTDRYRPQLIAQQEAVRKAKPVNNAYWATNSVVLSADQNRAVMLILLQGQRGEAPDQRLITATVQVGFEKQPSGQWQVADLSVLARPNPPKQGQ